MPFSSQSDERAAPRGVRSMATPKVRGAGVRWCESFKGRQFGKESSNKAYLIAAVCITS